MKNKRKRKAYRYTGDGVLIWDRNGKKALLSGQFISKALFDQLPKRDTMEHEYA